MQINHGNERINTMERLPVSICLVTYNRANLLPATIDSLLNQTFQDFELIISDDCSTDNTEEICREYARRDSRIKYRRNAKNLGMPGNLNASLQAANGIYLANLHDGDVYRPDLIECWKNALDCHPTAGFVFNAYQVVYPDGKPMTYREDYESLIEGHQLGYRLLSQWSSCVFGTVMARREVYEQLGWFDPQFGNYSDVDMWMRIARDYDVAYVNAPLMDLMPRDTTRFYAFVHWKVLLWLLGMHVANLQRYREIMPQEIDKLWKKYPARRRKYLLFQLLICLKHRRWDRVLEGLAIWRDCDDKLLNGLGKIFGNPIDAPDWYTTECWQMAILPNRRHQV
jgi:glycosyltransferase involved in cell wall biosynthesis